jgi:hypothetical protein
MRKIQNHNVSTRMESMSYEVERHQSRARDPPIVQATHHEMTVNPLIKYEYICCNIIRI